MRETLFKTITFGLTFGCLFSAFSYLAGNRGALLWLAPVIAAGLSGLGGIVAMTVTVFLRKNMLVSENKTFVLAFLAAAAVNSLLMALFFSYHGLVLIQREIIISILIGLALGGGYGLYHMRAERLQERMRFLEEMADKNRQLQQTTRRLAITEERNRMSRELHDSISQGLHGLVFTLYSLRNELNDPPERVNAILEHMEDTARNTLDELRHMIEELKPSVLVELGLAAAIKNTTELFSQRQAVPVALDIQIPQGISPELEMTIYRIIQEALANIEKHAQARHVQLRIAENESGLFTVITDDGCGFKAEHIQTGNGLRNMRQRTEDAGGVFEIISKPRLGTSIKVRFPSKG